MKHSDEITSAQQAYNIAKTTADILARKLHLLQHQEKLKRQKAIGDKNKVNTYYASDYAGMSCERFKFYFGYEETFCPIHKTKCGCVAEEWAFVAWDKTENELMRIPKSELVAEQCHIYKPLLIGIGIFLNKLEQEEEKAVLSYCPKCQAPTYHTLEHGCLSCREIDK